MTRIILAVLLLVGSAQTVRADVLDTTFLVTLPVYGGLAAIDAHGTIGCVRLGTCHEANILLRPIVDRHGIEVAMGSKLAAQAGVAAFAGWAMRRYPDQKKWIVVGFVTGTALQGVVVALNARTLRNAR